MNLKTEKLLTAVFAAALGASFIATNPNVKASAEVNPAMSEAMHIRPRLEMRDGFQATD